MGIYSYEEEERLEHQSANAQRLAMERRDMERRDELRREMERREQHERDLANAERAKRSVEKSLHQPMNMIQRELRQEVMQDPIGREARNIGLAVGVASSLVVGMSLMVASCAADASYNKAFMDAQAQSNENYKDDVGRGVQENINREQQTLAAYTQQVEETRQNIGITQQAYYVEYQDTKREAQQVIEAAQKDYNKEKQDLSREERRSDATYRKEVDAAQYHYDNDVKRINSEYSGAEKTAELQKAAERRDAQIDSASKRHESEIKSIADRAATAETKYNTAINHQNDVIQAASIKYKDEVQRAKQEHSNAETKLSHYQEREGQLGAAALSSLAQANNKSQIEMGKDLASRYGTADEVKLLEKVRQDDVALSKATEAAQKAMKDGVPANVNYKSTVTAEERQMAQQVAQKYASAAAAAEVQAMPHAVRSAHVGAESSQYISSLMRSHLNLGESLVRQLGTAGEVDSLNRVIADIRAEKQAKDSGQAYTPLTSKEERRDVDNLIHQYAGDISSEKGLKETIRNLNTAERDLVNKRDSLQQKIQMKTETMKDLDSSIAKTQATIKQIAADQRALKLGKDANGVKLTEEQRKAITERLQKNGKAEDQAKKLSDLKTKRNGLSNEIGRLKDENQGVVSALNRVTAHTKLLTKNGKAITDTIKAQKPPTFTLTERIFDPFGVKAKKQQYRDQKKNEGKSKRAVQMQKMAAGMICGSISRVQRELTKNIHKGNDIHQELKGTAMKMANVARKYDLAISIANFARKGVLLPATLMIRIGRHSIKVLGKENNRVGQFLRESKLGQKFAQLKQSKFGQRAGKIGKHMSIAGKGLSRTAGKLIRAPGNLLRAPMKLMNKPEELLKKGLVKTFNVTRKATGKVIGFGAHQAGKLVKLAGKGVRFGINRTIGRTKWYQRGAQRLNLMKQRLASFREKLSSALHPLQELKKQLKKKLIGILTSIASFISTLVASIVCLILAMAALLFIFLLLIVMLILIIALLASVLGAISDWFKNAQADEQSLIKNHPEYIINQAVNYRNYELNILELFNMASEDTSLIPVNKEPVYYALHGGKIRSNSAGLQTLESNNVGAQNHWEDLIDGLTDSGYELSRYGKLKYSAYGHVPEKSYELDYFNDFFSSASISKYNAVKLAYYPAKYLTKDENGNDALAPGAQASEFEISNAKDALAMVDALYTQKSETMQKLEVLSYLGVGDYQLAIADSDGKKAEDGTIPKAETGVKINNLFWATHKFIYLSGTEDSDVWYHVTEKTGEDYYALSDMRKYSADGTGTQSIEACQCDNYATITFKYHVPSTTIDYTHKTVNDYFASPSAYGEYRASAAASTTSALSSRSNGTALTGSQLYYYLGGQDWKKKQFTPALTASGTYNAKVDIYDPDVGADVQRSKTVYDVHTNSSDNVNLVGLHKDAACNRLNFYRYYGNKYHVVNSNGLYMGCITISEWGTYSALYNMITKVELYDKEYSINCSSTGSINLDYFYIIWNGSGYDFKVISSYDISKSTTPSNAQQYLNGSVNDMAFGGSDFTYKKPTFDASRIEIHCTHTFPVDSSVEHDVVYNVCRGHADLDVAIVVTTSEDGDLLYEEAMNVQGLEEPTEVGSLFGLFTFDSDQDVFGFGTLTQNAYDPEADWSEEGQLRDLAKAKIDTDHNYSVSSDKSAEKLAIDVVHYNGRNAYGTSSFKSLAESPDNTLLLGMMFDKNKYYVNYFISGEQKDIEYYLLDEDGNLVGPNVLSLGIPKSTGTPAVNAP